MARPRVVSFLYCVAFAAAATASHVDGSAPYEQIPLGAIFEQGSDEVQTAFKLAVFRHNKNNTDRRFEIQAYVDIIKTADAFKLSKLNVDAKLTATNKMQRMHRREQSKSKSNEVTKKRPSWRSRLFQKKPLTDNNNINNETTTVETTTITTTTSFNGTTGSEGSTQNRKLSGKSTPNIGHCKKQLRLARMIPVTVTQVQEQTTVDKSLTLPCRSFTPRTAVRPNVVPTDRQQCRTWSCSQTPSLQTDSPEPALCRRVSTAATLPTCLNRLGVDGASADEELMTKGFLKITTTERWTRSQTDDPC